MKELVASEPVIAQLLPTGVFRIEVDTSGFALGGVLSQHHPDGKWHPVAFISCVMSPAELNYNIYDKELLAIMYALDKWRPYLLHASEPFEIWTDHKNLAYFMSHPVTNPLPNTCFVHVLSCFKKYLFI
jgi:hypothetical protein